MSDERIFNQIKMTNAHSIEPPTPAPTPIAIFDVGDISEDDASAVAELVMEGEATFEIMASVEVDVESVVVVVAVEVVVDDGFVILKKLEVKPFGPSGFIQRKKTFE